MKQKQTILLLLLAFFGACTIPEPVAPPRQGQVLNLFILDTSGSDPWLTLTRNQIAQTMVRDSLYAAIYLAGIVIKENSRAQSPVVIGPIYPDMKPETGNAFHKGKIRMQNRERRLQFFKSCGQQADSLAHFLLKRPKAGYSDVNGGLELAQTLCEQPSFAQSQIRIILFCDLLQATKDGQPLHSFTFPANTTIYLIGKARGIDPVKVFPDNTVVELAQFQPEFLQP